MPKKPRDDSSTTEKSAADLNRRVTSELAAAEARFRDKLKSLGIDLFECVAIDDTRYPALLGAEQERERSRAKALEALPRGVETPPGWEGEPPRHEINSLADVESWLVKELKRFRVLTVGRRRDVNTAIQI